MRKDWKYFYGPEFDREQLFDLNADAIEENDLAAHPEYADTLAEMRRRFGELKVAAE